MKWETLRDLQAKAIDAWLERKNDIILMANTASGKTEAAFLPILSTLAPDQGAGSIRAMYVGPLKALINDQFRRLEDLCKRAEIPVHRWHGDVAAGDKKALLEAPSGVLLITPESLESLLVRHGRDAQRLFARLEAVVIDELHVFLDSERGRQLSSLLARVDEARGGLRTRRVALSATIGDLRIAQEWITDGDPAQSVIIQSNASRDVELMLKTFISEPATASMKVEAGSDMPSEMAPVADNEGDGLLSIAEHIMNHFSGSTNLVFFNRKMEIEICADFLRRLCERSHKPNEFLVHHGSLSKDLRLYAERELQSGRPCTALCSSTLELGIDVGYVDTVGQVGPPHSVSALKQRLGRSGRVSGRPSRLWMYVSVERQCPSAPLPDRLYLPLLQGIALVELMLDKWVEPPTVHGSDLSTLIQQILATIAQKGGAPATRLYEAINRSYAFSKIGQEAFAQVLRDIGAADLIEQVADGDLILGIAGERLTSHYDFYAAFESPESYEVQHAGRAVGSIEAVEGSYEPGQYLLLAGKRWRILEVDEKRKVIVVERAHGKGAVRWSGGGGHVHRRIREKMLELLTSESIPRWLEPNSIEVLCSAREAAKAFALANTRMGVEGDLLHLFTWTGSRGQTVLKLALSLAGLDGVLDFGAGLTIPSRATSEDQVRRALRDFVASEPNADQMVLAAFRNALPKSGKHGEYLSGPLRASTYASANLDVKEAMTAARAILAT